MHAIVVLIGPKGAGKSHLGRLLEARLGVGFVDVEAIFRSLPDPSRVAEGYDRVAAEVARRLGREPAVSLEVTGAAEETPLLLDRLASIARVRTIRIRAPLRLCLERIAKRDARTHLPASEEIIRRVHAISESLAIDVDLTIESGVTDEEAVVRRIAALL